MTEQQATKVFELQQEDNLMRGHITYLQEQLSMIEDQRDNDVARLECKIDQLETELGDALYRE